MYDLPAGYRKLNSYPHRDETNKWYLPRWLYWQDRVPEYLSGTGYLIHGNFVLVFLITTIIIISP